MPEQQRTIRVRPAAVGGTVRIPPSKSMAHRWILAAALARGTSRIGNLEDSADIGATREAVEALGARVRRGGDPGELLVEGLGAGPEPAADASPVVLHCRESGSTLRFLIPPALHRCGDVTLTGENRLVHRPLDAYYDLFGQKGIAYETTGGGLPLRVRGAWPPGVYRLSGDVSSQFVTGLLYTLPLLAGGSVLEITTPLASRGYVDLTLGVLEACGIRVENQVYQRFVVPGLQRFAAVRAVVEGDYSQAAFFLVAGILGGDLRIEGLAPDSRQGDRVVLDWLGRMGAGLRVAPDGTVEVRKGRTRALEADCGECPDLVPALAVLCACSEGTSVLRNLGRLRYKESDRLEATRQNLEALGARVDCREDSLVIRGQPSLPGGRVRGWKDHRMVMSMAVAALGCRGPVVVDDGESVKKSYPGFWEDFRQIGGQWDEWDLG